MRAMCLQTFFLEVASCGVVFDGVVVKKSSGTAKNAGCVCVIDDDKMRIRFRQEIGCRIADVPAIPNRFKLHPLDQSGFARTLPAGENHEPSLWPL